ncbi:MAG: hypothetical protein IKB65_04080 [Ruminiclostridium sp.]|nr:hypothetical protein [Ruminiclostridium sp.]
MEVKKINYSGVDTNDAIEKLEEGIAKMAEKGWVARREDMLSSSTVRVTFTRGEPDDEDDLDLMDAED